MHHKEDKIKFLKKERNWGVAALVCIPDFKLMVITL